MRPNSLAFRLFAAAAVWALVVLPITAIILISVYRGAVERNFDTRLNVYLTDLVADVVEARTNPAAKPPSITDPLFRRPFSGWYWQISPLGSPAQLLQSSESLLDQRVTLPSEAGIAADENFTRHANMEGPDKHRLRVLEREITIDEGESGKTRLSFAVSGNSDEIEKTISEFRTLLILALSVLGLGLVLATYFQVRFGLRPLRAIGQGLAAIRSGDAERLEGDLPTEIVPLQSELNALIQSNRAIVERARTHVGNLAHALKTPLSVITNEAAGKRTAFAVKVSEQSSLMRDQIAHHLNRASMAARTGVIGGQTRVEPVVKALIRALTRIYEERELTLSLECQDGASFHGEKHDLEEMVGNLLDNACKWAKSDISLTVSVTRQKIVITVDDDGSGLPKKERLAATKRGRRLDETKPGSGLGLSIVAELAHLYNGRLSLEKSEKGGLRARLELPGS
jgi:signal transduction histidine kinase